MGAVNMEAGPRNEDCQLKYQEGRVGLSST